MNREFNVPEYFFDEPEIEEEEEVFYDLDEESEEEVEEKIKYYIG